MFAAAKTGKLSTPGARTRLTKSKKSDQQSTSMNLIQTQLTFTKKENKIANNNNRKDQVKGIEPVKGKYELICLPKPQVKPKTVICANTVKNVEKCKTFRNRLLLGTRSLLGKVDFCLRMNKQFPHVDAIWDIYGKIIKIKKEPTALDRILIMRNDHSGAVLQAICNQTHDIEIHNLQIGNHVRAVGRFIGVNRLKVYSVDLITEEVWQSDFQDVHKLIETSLLELPD